MDKKIDYAALRIGSGPSRSSPAPSLVLPADHYRVMLFRNPLPSFEELKTEFGKGNVSDIFDGRPFELHSSCADMDLTPGDRIFYLHSAGRAWRREERITWGIKQRNAVAPHGYRPATPEEAYEFYKTHTELVGYVALGSSAMIGDSECCATFWGNDGRRILGCWINYMFSPNVRILFVSR